MAQSNAAIARRITRDYQQKLESGAALGPEDHLLVPPEQLEYVQPSYDRNSEKLLASSPVRMSAWGAPGDGSYDASGVPIVATGMANRRGTQFAVGAAAGNLAVNAFNRSRAKKNAQPRWMPFIPQGVMTVSSHGFYISHSEGLFGRNWWAVQDIKLRGPSTIDVVIHDQDLSGRYQIVADWAELIFVMWIIQAADQHPARHTWYKDEGAEAPAAPATDYGTGRASRSAPAAPSSVNSPGQTNALISVIFGVLGFVAQSFAPVAILCGVLAIWQAIRAGKAGSTSKLRIIGLVLGCLVLVAAAFWAVNSINNML